MIEQSAEVTVLLEDLDRLVLLKQVSDDLTDDGTELEPVP